MSVMFSPSIVTDFRNQPGAPVTWHRGKDIEYGTAGQPAKLESTLFVDDTLRVVVDARGWGSPDPETTH